MNSTYTASKKDILLLEIIARGHPGRTMTSTRHGVSKQVSALTWSELQLLSEFSDEDMSHSISRLVSINYINCGNQIPSFWGKLRGESQIAFFWISEEGKNALGNKFNSAKFQQISSQVEFDEDEEFDKMKNATMQLGYNITHYGMGIAILSLRSGYSYCETASNLAVVTLAHDIKSVGKDVMELMKFVPHARAMIDILTEFRDNGLMKESIFKNDVTAIIGMISPHKDRDVWISQVLSDPHHSQERVAVSRIVYK